MYVTATRFSTLPGLVKEWFVSLCTDVLYGRRNIEGRYALGINYYIIIIFQILLFLHTVVIDLSEDTMIIMMGDTAG